MTRNCEECGRTVSVLEHIWRGGLCERCWEADGKRETRTDDRG